MSLSNKPRSTLRRTPATSTVARYGIPGKSSITLPGMAKHIGIPFQPLLPTILTLFACRDVKGEPYFVFHFQAATNRGNGFDAVIRLPQGEFAEGAQQVAGQR